MASDARKAIAGTAVLVATIGLSSPWAAAQSREPGAQDRPRAAPELRLGERDRQGSGDPTLKRKSGQKPAPLDPAVSRAKSLSDLYAHLATAGDAGEAAPIAAAIEGLWLESGSDTVTLLLSRATQAMVEQRTELAAALFDAVTELAPDFAEGFARRAFFHHAQNDTPRALGDLRRAIALDPNHYRALDGMWKLLSDIGEKKAALRALKQLEAVHPNWPGLAESIEMLTRAAEGQGI